MKKLIKNLKFPVIVMLCWLLALLPAFGASVTYNASAASTNNIVALSGTITSIVLSGAGAASVKVQLFDAPTNTLTYVIGAYTNYTPTVVSQTNVFSTPLDTTVTNIQTIVTNVPATVAQSTNNFRVIGSYTVPTNEVVTINYDTPNSFFRGILVTNSAAVTITVNYLSWR